MRLFVCGIGSVVSIIDTDTDSDRVEKNEKNRNHSDINDDDDCVDKGVRKDRNRNGTHANTNIDNDYTVRRRKGDKPLILMLMPPNDLYR
mmetsp:Transcript_43469/g.44164  ORF Transcript_43469/g.44164 Transcript_43469/m.44164 type:complete len:90 (-) Transcript_43469:5-274(-)